MRDYLKTQFPIYKIYTPAIGESQSFCTNTRCAGRCAPPGPGKVLFSKSAAVETYRQKQENKQGGDSKSIDAVRRAVRPPRARFEKGRFINLVKPYLDLRRIRRGRVHYQVPRVLSREKRHLSGIRRICKSLVATGPGPGFVNQKKIASLKVERNGNRHWKEFPLFLFRENNVDTITGPGPGAGGGAPPGGPRGGPRGRLLESYSKSQSLRDQIKPKTKFLIHNQNQATVRKDANDLNPNTLLDKKSTCFSVQQKQKQQAEPHSKKLETRFMRGRVHKGNFLDPLSYSLGSEIKDGGRARRTASQAKVVFQEKKRIYRSVSLYKAFISLSW